jgi:hypothetical protein
MPRFYANFQPRQRYRLILITEKSSLRPILQPIAEHVGAELLAMTGESSHTRVAELAARADEDGLPAVVLYFSDHDPSGWQMPISVSRKLQALRDLLYPSLDIQVHRAALTAEQARELELPTTPLKESEKRGDNWKAKTGREQTELDAPSSPGSCGDSRSRRSNPSTTTRSRFAVTRKRSSGSKRPTPG